LTALFKPEHVKKILRGEKTQTRRVHLHTWIIGKVYPIKTHWLCKREEAPGKIIILRKFRQKLGEISPEDVKKEGYNSLEEFRREWEKLHGEWNPEQVVWVYEFKLVENAKTGKPSSAKENQQL